MKLIIFACLGAGCAGCSDAKTSPVETPPSTLANRLGFLASALFSIAVAGCSGSQTAQTQASSAPSGIAGAAFASPTPDPNLLAFGNGTIVRAYPTALTNDPSDIAVHGPLFKDGAAGPWQIVYELPGVATLSRIAVSLAGPDQSPQATVTIEASTQSADAGFHNLASYKATSGQDDPVVQQLGGASARWLRLTVDGPAANPFRAIAAFGTIPPRTANAATFAGVFVQRGQPYAGGQFVPGPLPSDQPLYMRVVAAPSGAGGQYCTAEKASEAFPGPFDGRAWTPDHPDLSRLVVNDEGTLIVGNLGGVPAYLARSTASPQFCSAQDGGGSGSTRVLVLDGQVPLDQYPLGDYAANEPDFHFTRLPVGMFDRNDLGKYDIVMFDGICRPADDLPAAETDALMDWVRAGHKVLLLTAGACTGADFGFLPYPFTASPTGKSETTGNALIEVENDDLGTLDATDTSRFLDPNVWANSSTQVPNASELASTDEHWCGHLFATNIDAIDGFVQAYARLGRGLLVFDGFDRADNDNASYQRMRRLELRADASGSFPCEAKPALPIVIEPPARVTFTPGNAKMVKVPFHLLASAGWNGHVSLTTSGALATTVTPSDVDIAGKPADLRVAVEIPKGAAAGSYTIFVTADSGAGQRTQTTLVLANALPLAAQLKGQARVRVYAIRFDPSDSARLDARSQVALGEIAKAMRSDKKARLRIEVYADEDLGKGRAGPVSRIQARALVDELAGRYHVDRKRLVAMGAGLANPVTSNATPAGKALNTRVELVRL